ncbi:cytochrome C [bacterium]|nr:MAG: cytochrome C [bacterium]
MLKRIISELIGIIVVIAVVVLAINYGVIVAERYFSSAKFCTSCHSMSYAYEALQKSAHYGPKGINPECRDCHFPPEFHKKIIVHVVTGLKDTISEINIGLTKESYEKRKDELGAKARADIKAWNSSPCRACHKSPAPNSEFGKAAHAKLQAGEATCVDCHQGQGLFH